MALGWVKVEELMVETPSGPEHADEAAAKIVKEILEADPRVHSLRVAKSETLIFRD